MKLSKYQNRHAIEKLNPEKWRIVSFGDVLLDETSKATKIKKENYLESGLYPIIDQGKGYIAGYAVNNTGAYFNDPMIIFGDHTRVLKYIDFPIFIGADGVKLLKNKFSEEEVLTKYLYYYLRTVKIPDTGYNRHFKYLKEIAFPIPDITIQKQIVNVIERAQALIDKRKTQIEALDQLTQSMFLKMFGDPISNPKNWPVKKLPDLLRTSFQNGLYVPQENYKKGVKMLHMSDIFHGDANIETAKEVEISDKEIEKYKVTTNDLLLARRSLNYEGAAKPCLIPEHQGDIVFESSLIRLSPNIDNVLPIYLFYYLNNGIVRKKRINKYITSSTISGINQKGLAQIDVVVPDIETQRSFQSFVLQIGIEKDKINKSLMKLEEYLQSVMHFAFRDKLFNVEKVSNI